MMYDEDEEEEYRWLEDDEEDEWLNDEIPWYIRESYFGEEEADE